MHYKLKVNKISSIKKKTNNTSQSRHLIKKLLSKSSLVSYDMFSKFHISYRRGIELSRVNRLVNRLTYEGKKKRAQIIVDLVKAQLKEYLGPLAVSGSAEMERSIARLEPMFDIRSPSKLFTGKKGGNSGGRVVLVPFPASVRRRTTLALSFLMEGVRIRCKKQKIPLEMALFQELLLISTNRPCFSFNLKKQHLVKVIQNRLNIWGGKRRPI